MAEAWPRLTSGRSGVVHVSWKIGDFDLFIPFSLLLHNLFGAKGWEVFLNDHGIYLALHMVFLFYFLWSGEDRYMKDHLGRNPQGSAIVYNSRQRVVVFLFYFSHVLPRPLPHTGLIYNIHKIRELHRCTTLTPF